MVFNVGQGNSTQDLNDFPAKTFQEERMFRVIRVSRTRVIIFCLFFLFCYREQNKWNSGPFISKIE